MADLKCSYCKKPAVFTVANLDLREETNALHLFNALITLICVCDEHARAYKMGFDYSGLTLLRRR